MGGLGFITVVDSQVDIKCYCYYSTSWLTNDEFV